MADPPSARDLLAQGDRVEVWCHHCQRHRLVDLQGLVAAGRGDVPLVTLPFRCVACDSADTGLVVLTKTWRPT